MEKAETKLELIWQYFPDLSEKQRHQLAQLGPAYAGWNEKINVISRKDIDSLYEKHVLHSLSIAAAFDFRGGEEILDIGTGGGFPGIPLAICFPETQFHLVDSIGKKIKVVEAIASETGLTNVTAQHARAEDLRNRKFDGALSRAVAPLKELWSWAKPLIKKQEQKQSGERGEQRVQGLICLKGGDLAAEISDSGTHPRVTAIHDLFPIDYFLEKYILYIPLRKV